MDQKIHKKLNVMETICVLLGISCLCLAAVLHYHMGIPGANIYQILLMVVGIIAEVLVVSTELMLFHLETLPYKFLTAGYYIAELVMIMLMNALVPFAGLLVLTIFSISKNVFRMMKVEVIYERLGWYELCKKFGIKVKKPRKARVTATKKKAPAKNKAKAKVGSKTREPNYA